MLRYSRVGLIALQKMNDPSEYWVSAATRLTGTRESLAAPAGIGGPRCRVRFSAWPWGEAAACVCC
jgi:hypothetical protein